MFELNIGNGSIPTSETAVLNSTLNTSIQDIIESIKSIADKIVENEGYIGISRQTEIISAKGLKQTISYMTYITYLIESKNGFSVSLCKSDGKEMLHFRDNFNDDKLHENFYGQEAPATKIAHLLAQHYMLEKQETLSVDDIEELKKFQDELLDQSVKIHK